MTLLAQQMAEKDCDFCKKKQEFSYLYGTQTNYEGICDSCKQSLCIKCMKQLDTVKGPVLDSSSIFDEGNLVFLCPVCFSGRHLVASQLHEIARFKSIKYSSLTALTEEGCAFLDNLRKECQEKIEKQNEN